MVKLRRYKVCNASATQVREATTRMQKPQMGILLKRNVGAMLMHIGFLL